MCAGDRAIPYRPDHLPNILIASPLMRVPPRNVKNNVASGIVSRAPGGAWRADSRSSAGLGGKQKNEFRERARLVAHNSFRCCSRIVSLGPRNRSLRRPRGNHRMCP